MYRIYSALIEIVAAAVFIIPIWCIYNKLSKAVSGMICILSVVYRKKKIPEHAPWKFVSSEPLVKPTEGFESGVSSG